MRPERASERYLDLQGENGDWTEAGWHESLSCLVGYNVRTFVRLVYRGDFRLTRAVELLPATKRARGRATAFSPSGACGTLRPVSAHEPPEKDVNQLVLELVEEYRDRCLWFMRPDFCPTTDEERHRALNLIVRHGDRRAYERVMEIRQWLSQRSSSRS